MAGKDPRSAILDRRPDGTVAALSTSDPSVIYTVRLGDAPSCTCPAGAAGRSCYHLRAALQRFPEEPGLMTTAPQSTDAPARFFTARYQNPALKEGVLTPVRITLGYPKFVLGYALRGGLQVLAPSRAIFHLHGAEFAAAYRAQLDATGTAVIAAALDAVEAQHGPCALCCFEDVRDGGTCHRRVFAQWWEERTGEVIPELDDHGKSKKKVTAQPSLFEAPQ